jgi:hypothetical protein
MTTNNIQQLEISQIVAHADIQPRVEIHQETVNEYAEEMLQGAKFPPVVLFRDDDRDFLLACRWFLPFCRLRPIVRRFHFLNEKSVFYLVGNLKRSLL